MEESIKPAVDEYTWKSANISQYIRSITDVVQGLDQIVRVMKESLMKIQQTLKTFTQPLLERKHKTTVVEDFKSFHDANLSNKLANIKQDGQNIGRLVKEVSDVTKVNKKTDEWRQYIEYVNEVVITGVIEAVTKSLEDLNNNITPDYLKKRGLPAFFEVKLGLDNNLVKYEPELEDRDRPGNLMNYINSWISDFMKVATLVSRLDGQGDFLTEVRDAFEIRYALSTVGESFYSTILEADKYRGKFTLYDYFWTTDPNEIFEEFLHSEYQKELEAYQEVVQAAAAAALEVVEQPKATKNAKGVAKEEIKAPVKKPQEEFIVFDQSLVLLKNATANIPKMSKFYDKISGLKAIQEEVGGIKTPHDLGWLKVDVQPLKSLLNVKVTNAIRVYTDFLRHQVKQILENIKGFMVETTTGIKKNPKDHDQDTELLMAVMKIISQVKVVGEGNKPQKLLKRVKDMIELLKEFGIVIEEDLEVIGDAYYDITKKAFDVKTDILPLINNEKTAIKLRIEQFLVQIQEFRNEFVSKLPVYYEEEMTLSNINSCYDVLTDLFMKMQKYETEAKEYEQLELLFELEQTNYKQLKDCRSDLKSAKMFWDMVAMVTYYYNSWKQLVLWHIPTPS